MPVKSIFMLLCAILASFPALVHSIPMDIVPRPVYLKKGSGFFTLDRNTRVVIQKAGDKAGNAVRYLLKKLAEWEGLDLPGDKSSQKAASNVIVFTGAGPSFTNGDEGYELKVTPVRAVITASAGAGFFYGAVTFLQILYSNRAPVLTISDRPRFGWRGYMLDVGRSFYPPAYIRKTLDWLAYNKFNVFHWHLTDDQGWRIEIKRYPELTRTGAWRGDDHYGGFYTQDEVRDIVDYARGLCITVVPEIEMPGHCTAALASYPEFSCAGGPFEVATNWGVHKDVFCAGNEGTYAFLENVLDEVMGLFPSEYIHIGGDECPKDRWNACPKCLAKIKEEGLRNAPRLQAYFIKRIGEYLESKGRKLIGWDEILQGDLYGGAAVMNWRSVKDGIDAADSGHYFVAAPCDYTYVCSPLSRTSMEKVYSFDPYNGLPEDERFRCLGLEGVFFSEGVTNSAWVDWTVIPRMCALGEVAWSLPGDSYEGFSTRFYTQARRLKAMGLGFSFMAGRVVAGWKPSQMSVDYFELEWDITAQLKKAGAYEFEPCYTKGAHGIDISGMSLLEDGEEIASDIHDGFAGGRPRDCVYRLELKHRDSGARYVLRMRLRSNGGTDSEGSIYMRKAND